MEPRIVQVDPPLVLGEDLQPVAVLPHVSIVLVVLQDAWYNIKYIISREKLHHAKYNMHNPLAHTCDIHFLKSYSSTVGEDRMNVCIFSL